MSREEIPLQIPKQNQNSALFELLITTLAFIYVLHDSINYEKYKSQGFKDKELQDILDASTKTRREIIEETKLDIIATLTSKYAQGIYLMVIIFPLLS